MATILKAGNVATGAQITSDATGILEIRTGTGAGTTAITVGTDQAVTFAAGTTINGITVGRGAGAISTNTAVGASALAANTTGSTVTAIGFETARVNTTGDGLFAGYRAGYANTTGYNLAAVGGQALFSNTTGFNNTAVGYQAGFSNTTGTNNTLIGLQAGYGLTTGSRNTFVGAYNGSNGSGRQITTGSANTILGGYDGNQGGLNITTASNYIVLSDGDGNPKYYHTSNQHTLNNDNTQFTILNFAKNAVNVGRFYSDATNTRLYAEVSSNGVYLASGGTSWTSASDERKKDIVEPITNAANKVSTLRAVIGKYKTDEEGTRRSFLIAQDVQAVLPEAVDASDHDNLGVQYTDVIPLLVAAIKELKAEIDALKGQS
jgi:hypothetical protein